MAGREKDWEDGNGNEGGSPDPETLYTKEFCIGSLHTCLILLLVAGPGAWIGGEAVARSRRALG